MTKLGVNIDHVATLRQARMTCEPDPVAAAFAADLGGADGITIHLREDRRHIQDRDLTILRRVVFSKLNLEMAVTPAMVKTASRVRPDQCTLVPEKREEITTEGGLDVRGALRKVRAAAKALSEKRMAVSLFIDPVREQIEASRDAGADFIELHTGAYANAKRERVVARELRRLAKGAEYARQIGLRVNAGHGLNYKNVGAIVRELRAEELNIGHSIIARAVFVGLESAVREMKRIIEMNCPGPANALGRRRPEDRGPKRR